MTDATTLLSRLQSGEHLTREQARELIDAMMRSTLEAELVKQVLLAWREKGETVEEIAGAADSLRAHMVRIPTRRSDLVDTCGTGGDRSGTFNVSTAAAIVTAACGVAVAKHGNRSVTSRTGSADVLEVLGVRLDLEPPEVARTIDEVGIGFCFAPKLHPAMKYVAPIRRELGVPTIFNLLGPLCNPAGAPHQLIGVGNPAIVEKLARALHLLGTEFSWVVHGADGLDEITCGAETEVWEIHADRCERQSFSPEDAGLAPRSWQAAVVEGPEESARVIRGVLAGEPGPARDLVVLNATASVRLARPGERWKELRQAVEHVIDSGAARAKLEQWIEASRS